MEFRRWGWMGAGAELPVRMRIRYLNEISPSRCFSNANCAAVPRTSAEVRILYRFT